MWFSFHSWNLPKKWNPGLDPDPHLSERIHQDPQTTIANLKLLFCICSAENSPRTGSKKEQKPGETLPRIGTPPSSLTQKSSQKNYSPTYIRRIIHHAPGRPASIIQSPKMD
jgi:hypothetical protein